MLSFGFGVGTQPLTNALRHAILHFKIQNMLLLTLPS